MKSTPPNKPRYGRSLWIALISLVVGSGLLLAYVLWSAYHDAWTDARLVAANQAELVESRLDAALRRVEATLIDIAVDLPHDATVPDAVAAYRPVIEKALQRHQKDFPEIAGFRVIDPDGNVIYRSGEGDYVNLADRAYFRQAIAAQTRDLVFSEVLQSRMNGRSALVAALAIRAANGRAMGVVSAAIDLEHFEQLFKSVRLGNKGALAIRRSDDHSLVIHEPPLPDQVNRPLDANNPLRLEIDQGRKRGTLEYVAQVDQVRRLYGYGVLDRYPFYVQGGLSEADFMVHWRKRVLVVTVIGMGLLGCFLLVFLGLLRAQRREQLALMQSHRSEEQLKAAQRIARLGSWEINLATKQVTCSDELFRIFEIPPAIGGKPYDEFFAQIHPEDREMVDMKLNAVLTERRPGSIRHRLQLPNGRVKHVLESCEIHVGSDGEPDRLIGTSLDVTREQEAAAQMQLLASAVQFSGEAILITDADNKIITVNPAFTRLTGYSAEEAVGQNPRFLSAGRTTKDEYQWMWHDIIERGFWQGEIWDRRKDGATYPKWMSISVIRDEGGKVRYYVAHFTDVTSEREAEERLHHIAHHDVLTGLLNRLGLKGHLDQALAAARRNGSRVAVMFIDLDRFKVINDTLGHHMGDELLVEVAHRLREAVRDSDVVARLGGDEFVIMLTGVEHTSAVATVAEKLVLNIADPYRIGGHDVYTSPSIGISIFPTDGDNEETLMKNADAAMYHAKSAGRNNFQFFNPKMNDVAVERLKTEHALRLALEREEFCLHFQPIVRLSTGKVEGVEALVRWQHPEKGLVAPSAFIGIAEETGLIQPLGDWILWAACRQLATFANAGLTSVRMGINISAIQMRNGNLPTLTKGAIESFGLNPKRLVFEMTESVAMEQPAETVRILDLLQNMGLTLAVDDFGTGYSSLSYLRMFPIDHLKLDRSFVQEIGIDSDDSAICDATIALAHNLGLKVVAEGVETEAQLAYLHERGCDFAQGYLYSKPLSADEIVDFIQNFNN